MKFYVEEREVETFPHESLDVPRPNTVAFERVLDSTRRIRGLGEYITEPIQKQIFIELVPVTDERADKDCVKESLVIQSAYNLKSAIFTALETLKGHSGYGPFDLWIMGRRYGNYHLATSIIPSTKLLEELYFIIDDDMGFNREEWGI